jgi:putative endopeptidase
MNRRFLLLAGALAAAGCTAMHMAKHAPDHAAIGKWGVDLGYMDASVKPGDDFFRYANGAWLKTAQIPPDRSYAGVILDLRKGNEDRLKTIFAELDASPAASLTDEQHKLRDLYDAFVDQKAIDAAGLAPAKADLDAIAALKTKDQVVQMMSDPALSLDGPFSFGIGIDEKNPDAYAVRINQSGLGLPDRDYYLRNDKTFAATREAYKKYLAAMLDFAGMKGAQKRADAVFALEMKIARAHWPAADRRDADKTYNPMTIAALQKLTPGYSWRVAFAKAGVALTDPKGERQFIVAEKSAFPKLAKIFADTPVSVWRDYLTTRYMHVFAADLPKPIDDANFAFYGATLYGNPEQLDRNARGVHVVDGAMGEALGKLYVAKYFPPEAKAKAAALVTNILKAYEADIKTLDWMTDATRQKALDKLHRIMIKVGYPDKWRDYSALQISRTDLIGDVKNYTVFEWNRELKRIDQPVDRTEWGMTPPTVNAYYSRGLNEIVFPAGYLQPPMFDPNADDAVNYGSAGSTIGHEISHGFDDQGSKFDASGALNNWWTAADRANFDARTNALAGQFDSYEPLPGIHVNGKLTLGENIADLAGLEIAFKAYHISLGGKPAPVRDGITGDQRFFLAYGQKNRDKFRDEILRVLLLSDPHSPDEFRDNGCLRNVDGWYAAFDVKPGDKYYLPPDQRVRLW